jgi:hypothetical protein
MDEILVTTKHGRGRPAIVGLGSEFVVVWTEPGNQNLRGARFDLVVADLERMRAPAVASTLDGNFVISWVAALPDPQVRAAIFNSEDGGRVGPEIAVNSSSGSHFAPSIAGFAGAGLDDVTFAIAWNGGENGLFRSRFQLFDFDGKKSGLEIVPQRTAVGEIAPATFGGQNIEDPREFISVLGGINGNEGQKLTADLCRCLPRPIRHQGDGRHRRGSGRSTALPQGPR